VRGSDDVLARALEVELDWLGRGMLSEALNSLGALVRRGGPELEAVLKEVLRGALGRDAAGRREVLLSTLGPGYEGCEPGGGALVGVVSGAWELVEPLAIEHAGVWDLALVPEGVLVALDKLAPWRLLDLEVDAVRWDTSVLTEPVLETTQCLLGSMRLRDALGAACALEDRSKE
jgi:hypothetical protein